MNPSDSHDGRSSASSLEARVRLALPSHLESSRAAVLAQIAGRTPEQCAEDDAAQRVRTLAQAAAVVLFILTLASTQSKSRSLENRIESSNVVAVVTPQDSDEAATKEGIFAELFAVEVPE